MTSPRSVKGRICHGRNSVPVPDSVRLDLHNRYGAPLRVAKALGIGEVTARAMLEPYGVVRADVLERVQLRLKETA